MDDDSELIISRWREATVAPQTRDEAELQVRRIMAVHDAERQRALVMKAPADERLTLMLGQESALQQALTLRIARKEIGDLQTRVEHLHGDVIRLEALVNKRLESGAEEAEPAPAKLQLVAP